MDIKPQRTCGFIHDIVLINYYVIKKRIHNVTKFTYNIVFDQLYALEREGKLDQLLA